MQPIITKKLPRKGKNIQNQSLRLILSNTMTTT